MNYFELGIFDENKLIFKKKNCVWKFEMRHEYLLLICAQAFAHAQRQHPCFEWYIPDQVIDFMRKFCAQASKRASAVAPYGFFVYIWKIKRYETAKIKGPWWGPGFSLHVKVWVFTHSGGKSTPSTALPSMLARMYIIKCTPSDYWQLPLWFTEAHHISAQMIEALA